LTSKGSHHFSVFSKEKHRYFCLFPAFICKHDICRLISFILILHSFTHSMANENDLEWFTPGKSCKKGDTKPCSGFDLLHFSIPVF
jgi:hypothetical protein